MILSSTVLLKKCENITKSVHDKDDIYIIICSWVFLNWYA